MSKKPGIDTGGEYTLMDYVVERIIGSDMAQEKFTVQLPAGFERACQVHLNWTDRHLKPGTLQKKKQWPAFEMAALTTFIERNAKRSELAELGRQALAHYAL